MATATLGHSNLSVDDLVMVAYIAGFRGAALETAVMVALAESKGNPQAVGDTKLQTGTWGPSIGLWQIRSLNKEKGKGGLRDEQLNYDPLRNAFAAYTLFKSSGFRPWTTYTKGTYTKYGAQVQQAIKRFGGSDQAIAGAVARAFSDPDQRFSKRIGSRFHNPADAAKTVPGAPGFTAPTATGDGVDWAALDALSKAGLSSGDIVALAKAGESGTLGRTPIAGSGGLNVGVPSLGSGTVPAGAPDSGTRASVTANMSDAQVDDYIKRNFGTMAWSLAIPELATLFRQYARGQLNDNELDALVRDTHWFQTHNASARDFAQLRAQDPMEAERQLSQLATSVRIWATRQGLDMTQERARTIGEHALSVGMSQEDVQRSLVNELSYNPTAPPTGDIGALYQQVKQLATGYLVPMSDATAFDWAKKMTTGEASQDALTAYLSDVAKSRFPQLAAQLDMGFTPSQILEPYRELVADELEVAPTGIDFLHDSRFAGILSHPDAKVGQRMMSLSEAQTYVRSLPAWRTTKRARQLGTSVALDLGRRMGVIAG